MNRIIFPENNNIHYYKIHYQYIMDLFRVNKWCIELKEFPALNKGDNYFECIINDKKVYFDYSDSGDCISQDNIQGITFKMHYRKEHKEMQNVFPINPVSFYYKDWKSFDKMRIQYICNSNKIIYKCRPYGRAIDRRLMVNEILYNYDKNIDFSIIPQKNFWHCINDMLVMVHVPGFDEYILDRANLQYMFLGACVICPEIKEILPYNIKLQPMLHYIKCADDYSDLIEKIEWCKNNRQACIDIGNAVKKLCQKYLMPNSLIEWILERIGE